MNGILHIDARDARSGDEIFCGPQGPMNDHPSIYSIESSTAPLAPDFGGRIVPVMRCKLVADWTISDDVLFMPEDRLIVYRRPD